MTIRIPLTRGKYALVDDDDAEPVGQFKWNARPNRTGLVWYAARTVWIPDGQRFITQRMHSLITGFVRTDHINGDGLDNRRSNLREASHAENQRNQWKTHGTSRYKGVSLNNGKGKPWHAQLRIGGSTLHLGRYDAEEDAALAYDVAARRLFGDFAALNFPQLGERSALQADAPPLASSDETKVLTRPARRTGPWPKRKVRSSRFKGVHFDRKSQRWITQFQRKHIGVFADEEAAACAYDRVAREALGARALLNFPGPGEVSVLGEGPQSLHIAALWVASLLVVIVS